MARPKKNKSDTAVLIDETTQEESSSTPDPASPAAAGLLKGRGLIPEFRLLPVKDLIPTPDNTRTVQQHSEGFLKLLGSIKRSGVKVPVIVRPHPTQEGKYDLRAGARRMLASKLAKLKEIPALVYHQMTDEDAFDATFFENFGREDLNPIEESAAVSLMLERHHGDLTVVADKLDKTPQWVTRRSHVADHLSDQWKAALLNEDGPFTEWSISHLELIARFDMIVQTRLLDKLSNHWNIDTMTVEELSDLCGRELRTLKKVKWDLDQVFIDGNTTLCACSSCPRRSSRSPLLWGEDSENEGGQDDRCLDKECYTQKLNLYIQEQLKINAAKYDGLQTATLNCDYADRREIQKKLKGVVELDYKYMPANKKDPKAKPYFVVGGKSAGSVVWRKPIPGSSVDPDNRRAGNKKPVIDRSDALKRKRYNHVLKQLHTIVRNAEHTQIVYADKAFALLVLVSQFGTSGGRTGRCGRDYAVVSEKIKNAESEGKNVTAEVWELVKPRIIESFSYGGPITQVPDDKIEAGRGAAYLLQIDFEALFEQAKEAIPTPKSLMEKKRFVDPDGDAEEAAGE